jgi:leucyl aminopeptidase
LEQRMTSWSTIETGTLGHAGATVILASAKPGAFYSPAGLRVRAEEAARSANFPGKGRHWMDVIPANAADDRLLILNVGSDHEEDRWRNAGGHLVAAMRALDLASIRLPASAELGIECEFADLLEGAMLHGFRLDQERRGPTSRMCDRRILVSGADAGLVEQATLRALAINRARAWVEQPANKLIPAVFADEAERALTAQGVTVRILGRQELQQLGAEGLLAVAAGSQHDPRLLVAEWRGNPNRSGWDAALVGKGVTFDGGGLNLKARPIIEKMKFDMAGAAAVLAALEMAATRRCRANVVAVVPMTENTIDGKAYRPGDVIRSLAGLTIEVINTDAEGRIILADAITYAIDKYDPSYVVDVATLTGLITGVLHEEYAALYANDDSLAAGLMSAGADSHEELWRMPLSAKQDYLVESAVADVVNYGPSGYLGFAPGSPVAAAKFLERFASERRWAHIDIAGTAWVSRRTSRTGAGATGFGVSLLDRWLRTLETD